MVSDRERAGRAGLSALCAKAWRRLGPGRRPGVCARGCAHLHERAIAARGRGAPTRPWVLVPCVPGEVGFCGRLTEWLMESLRKDAADAAGSAPWETGVAKPDVAHQTVAFDRAWWGACVPDATRPCRSFAVTALVTLRSRAKKVKGLFGKRQLY
uniref:Uncharacterized protein n=1 Tax=Setaria viridis TaxID=4556 RepID=A0A4U6VYU6_SETVI|nr:hypothetical protein SEVIR_2G297000v2 [Setaria viridis]